MGRVENQDFRVGEMVICVLVVTHRKRVESLV